jgi:hypothetical protein
MRPHGDGGLQRAAAHLRQLSPPHAAAAAAAAGVGAASEWWRVGVEPPPPPPPLLKRGAHQRRHPPAAAPVICSGWLRAVAWRWRLIADAGPSPPRGDRTRGARSYRNHLCRTRRTTPLHSTQPDSATGSRAPSQKNGDRTAARLPHLMAAWRGSRETDTHRRSLRPPGPPSAGAARPPGG